MRGADANETFGELGSVFGGTLVDLLIKSAIFPPLVLVDLEYHDGWCALKSHRIRVSGVVKGCSIEGGDQIATLVTIAVWRRLSICE